MSKHPRGIQKEQERKEERRHWWQGVTRDIILFGMGAVLLANEAFIRKGPTRPELLILIAGMLGLPLVFRGDQARRNGEK